MRSQAPSGSALDQSAAMKCNGAKDVVRLLQQATQSAAPVTLDLNHVTIDHPQHLAALRNLCSSAASHVTLSNGTIVLGGGGKPVLRMKRGRLSFKNMEIVRLVTGTPPPAPNTKGYIPSNRAMDVDGSMISIAASISPGAPTSAHVTLEDCTLRMEGDPRYNMGPAVLAVGAAKLRMDRCKLINMHPVMTAMAMAQVELYDCHVNMVFGTLLHLHVYVDARVSLHGCTLVEEEGTFMPPAASLLREPPVSMCVAMGGSLELVNTRVRMPLGAQLGRTAYMLQCTASTITATDCSFDSTFVSLEHPAPGCSFTRCNFSTSRATGTASAFLSDTRRLPMAVLLCDGGPDLVIEDCTFTNATDRAAIQRRPQVVPPSGNLPFLHVKGCHILNCLHGIQVCMVGEYPLKAQLTVEVEDTTIEVTPSPIAPQEPQTCLYLEGQDVCAAVSRCVFQAKGQAVDTVFAKEGAHLVMTDCTVILHGPGTAMVLGLSGSPMHAVIERTTITADVLAGIPAAEARPPVVIQGRCSTIAGLPMTVHGMERALKLAFKNRGPIEPKIVEKRYGPRPLDHMEGEDMHRPAANLHPASPGGAPHSDDDDGDDDDDLDPADGPRARVVGRKEHGVPPVVWVWSRSSVKLIDCKIQGSDQHCGITVRREERVELVKCEIAPERPMLMPWAAVDPHGTIILKDCTVGDCIKPADAWCGSSVLLDNTPYPPWADIFPDDPQPAGSRLFMSVQGGPDNTPGGRLVTYLHAPATHSGPDSSRGGADNSAVSSSTTGRVAQGNRGGPLVVPGGPWWPDTCHECDVSEATWAAAQGDPSRVMPWCQGCTCVRFCSRACQKECWSEHKPMCQYISQHYGQATGGSKEKSR